MLLVDVIEVRELRDGEYIDRELLLARVNANGQNKSKVEQIASQYGGRLVDSKEQSVIVEATGTTETLDKLVEQLRPRAQFCEHRYRPSRRGLPRWHPW